MADSGQSMRDLAGMTGGNGRVMAETVVEFDPAGRPLTVYLPDSRMAFYQRREDDCMRAAVATIGRLEGPFPS